MYYTKFILDTLTTNVHVYEVHIHIHVHSKPKHGGTNARKLKINDKV